MDKETKLLLIGIILGVINPFLGLGFLVWFAISFLSKETKGGGKNEKSE